MASAKPAIGLYPPDNPIFGTPKNHYSYDPDRAKALLKEAGYGPGNPVKAKIMISTSGSGQMMPIPMNEFMQQNFKAVGMDIEFDVVEWGTMLVAVRNAPTAPQSHGDHGINISLSYTDPSSMFRYYAIDSFSPTNYNWGHWSNQEFTDLVKQGAGDVRSGGADEAAGAGARDRRRRGAVAVHRARPQSARDVEEGDGIQSGAELVAGLHADQR